PCGPRPPRVWNPCRPREPAGGTMPIANYRRSLRALALTGVLLSAAPGIAQPPSVAPAVPPMPDPVPAPVDPVPQPLPAAPAPGPTESVPRTAAEAFSSLGGFGAGPAGGLGALL